MSSTVLTLVYCFQVLANSLPRTQFLAAEVTHKTSLILLHHLLRLAAVHLPLVIVHIIPASESSITEFARKPSFFVRLNTCFSVFPLNAGDAVGPGLMLLHVFLPCERMIAQFTRKSSVGVRLKTRDAFSPYVFYSAVGLSKAPHPPKQSLK